VECEATLRSLNIDGQVHRVILLRDVGEVRALQKRMSELEKMSVLGQLIASITHEINNPLAVINGYAELLEGSAIPEEEREYARIIREAGERCHRVVETFLGQYRSRPFTPKRVKLAEVVKNAAQHMDFHLRYHLVKLELEVDESLEVLADAGQFEQVLINLMGNALKAMQGRPTRLLRVRVGATPRGADVDVSDTGCGMPAADLEKLFQRGFTARKDGTGHGIGLALSQEIAQRHGGSITVTSEPDRGTTFTVHLPALSMPSAPPSEARPLAVPAAI
jgi:signal transduction histidine kinase